MLTRKHFKQLAAQLSEERPASRDISKEFKTWIGCCKAVAVVCNESNPNFDRHRFLDACGVPDKHNP